MLETKACAEFNNLWIVCTRIPITLLSYGDNTLKSTCSGWEPEDYIRYMAGGKRKSQGLGAIARREKSRARWLAMQSKDNSSQALEELAENIARGGESSNTAAQTYVLIIDVFIWCCYFPAHKATFGCIHGDENGSLSLLFDELYRVVYQLWILWDRNS